MPDPELIEPDFTHLRPDDPMVRPIKAFVDRAKARGASVFIAHPWAVTGIEEQYPRLLAQIAQRRGRAARVWRDVPVYELPSLREGYFAAVKGDEAREILDSEGDEADRVERLEALLGVALTPPVPDDD